MDGWLGCPLLGCHLLGAGVDHSRVGWLCLVVAHGVWDAHCPCSCPMSWFGPCGEQGCVPCDTPGHHPSHPQSRDMLPATPAIRDVPYVHCPITSREQGYASTICVISHVPRVHCPFHPREEGHVPSTTCCGHILCALSLPPMGAGMCTRDTCCWSHSPPTGAGCPQDTCLWGCPTCPFLLWEQGYVSSATPSACPMCTVPPPRRVRDISPCHMLLGPYPSCGAEEGLVPTPCATRTYTCHVVPSHGTCPPT